MALQASFLLPPPATAHGSAAVSLSFHPSASFLMTRSSRPSRYSRSSSFQRCVILSAVDPSEIYEREEARWLREEQRWIREEERWQREELRWQAERISLQNEIQTLKSALADIASSNPEMIDRLKSYWIGGSFQTEGALEAELVHRRLPVNPTAGVIQNSSKTLAISEPAGVPAESSSLLSNGRISESGVSRSSDSSTSGQFSAPQELSSKEILQKIPAADVIAAVASRTVVSKVSVPEKPVVVMKDEGASMKPRRSLGVGAEGEDVKEMQLMLESLGFYPGEDDLENDYFSEDTESAVKTWQATVNVRETGVMSPELLAMLYGGAGTPVPPEKASPPKAPSPTPTRASGSAPAATREKREIERYARSDLEGGERRVFLLGENRWEEPRRVSTKEATVATLKASATLNMKTCHGCRGEGAVVCLECEGTGDLNVEEQFLDWAGEDAKCLYCEGNGSTPCDSCGGAGLIPL